MKPAVFLDRDGTIIVDQHYPRDPEKVELTPHAIEGLRCLSEKGYPLFVVSNQSGVGRGIIKDSEFRAVHERVAELLRAAQIEIVEFGYCFHRPDDECNCRKPRAGLVPKDFAGAPIDFARSFVIGDTEVDVGLGTTLGASPYLILTGKGRKTLESWESSGRPRTFEMAEDLLDFARKIPSLK